MLTPGANGSVYLGHLASIPIYAHWTAVFMLYFAYLWSLTPNTPFDPSMFLLCLAVLLIAIVLHELGHGLMAKMLGATGITITLTAFGGQCQSIQRRSPGQSMLVIAAGPAVNFLLAGLSYGAFTLLQEHDASLLKHPFAGGPTWLGHFLSISMVMNLVLGIFNMLPIFPLDGGQLAYNGALLATRREPLARSITLTLAVIGAVAAFAGLTYLNRGQVDPFNGVILVFLVAQAFAALR